MKMLKSLLNPISRLAFDLSNSDKLKNKNALQVLSEITETEIYWKRLPHSQILNVLANFLGYHPIGRHSSWNVYIQWHADISKSIDDAYHTLNPISFDWLEQEDGASSRWYFYLRKNELEFKSRLEYLRKYMEIRVIRLNRCIIKNISFIGSTFGPVYTVEGLFKSNNLWNDMMSYQERTFFKSSMGWLYLFDSKLIYCDFLNVCLRNAVFHNVNLSHTIFSSKEICGDIMGADFSYPVTIAG